MSIGRETKHISGCHAIFFKWRCEANISRISVHIRHSLSAKKKTTKQPAASATGERMNCDRTIGKWMHFFFLTDSHLVWLFDIGISSCFLMYWTSMMELVNKSRFDTLAFGSKWIVAKMTMFVVRSVCDIEQDMAANFKCKVSNVRPEIYCRRQRKVLFTFQGDFFGKWARSIVATQEFFSHIFFHSNLSICVLCVLCVHWLLLH